MAKEHLDSIVSPTAERADYQRDWTRQRETARTFLNRFEAGLDTQLLADEVGMGKTYVAMGVMATKLLRPTKNDRRALLITPSSAVLRSKWEQELRSFSQNYLLKESKRRTLRPLIVRNFWELVANLHDYENDQIERISAERLRCILDSVWQWAVKSGYLKNGMKCFHQLIGFDRSSVASLQFSSAYSRAAWWAFLDEYKARQEHSIRALIGALHSSNDESDLDPACVEIKRLFKVFASQQDAYEPNVLILGMSALQTPRSDQYDRQRFSTFILGVLLKGRWEQTRKAFLKTLRAAKTLLPDADSEMLSRLARADLYRTGHCVAKALTNVDLGERWQDIQSRKPHADEVKSFFKDFMKAVVSLKLRESGIELVVVDEAHNWKDGKNGGSEFKETFAPAIKHKLLLSATPFQLAEGEMRRVFDHAAMPGGNTQLVLAEIYGQERVVESCLAANDLFKKAWDLLVNEPDSVDILNNKIEANTGRIGLILNDLRRDPAVSSGMRDFSRTALAYRDSVDRLAELQRKIVVRHVKPRSHRSFHSGSAFGTHPAKKRTALYATDGMAKNSDAFIHFLAMRLDQKLRIDGQALSAANAHLMGGLTSSKAAFESSAARLSHMKAAPEPATQNYVSMFNAALDHHEHPKVLATVQHTLANYQNGRKTLIFCERVDTLNEISDLLRKRLEEVLPQGDGDWEKMRENLLKNESFVDMRLAWMLCMRATGGSVVGAERILSDVRPQAVNFAVECFMRSGAPVTERRVLRLLDLFALSELGPCHGLEPPTLILFKLLRDFAESSESDHARWLGESILHMRSDGPQKEERDLIASQVERIAEGYFGQSINLWEGDGEMDFITALWSLVQSEAKILLPIARGGSGSEREVTAGFYATLTLMQRGLRKVLLRPDLFRAYLCFAGSGSLHQRVHAGVRSQRGDGEAIWKRMVRFVRSLVDSNGTINLDDTTNTRRRSLWQGVNLQGSRLGILQDADSEAKVSPDDLAVQTLYGDVKADRRIVLCAAFNSPLAPDILICTSIGSEGIDLHKECAEVIHHDLPWNPARLEQRIGRIDRVGRLAESKEQLVRVGVPFQEQSYERFQHTVLLARAQRFEVLLGKPDFDLSALEEEDLSSEDGNMVALKMDADATSDTPPPCLPEELVQWLSVDLSLPEILPS